MIVMKFGGTSVEDAKAIDRTACHRERARLAATPVVVVSAMAKVTDNICSRWRGSRSRRT